MYVHMYEYRLHTNSISHFEVRLNFKQIGIVFLFLLLDWLKPVCGNASATVVNIITAVVVYV